MNEAESMEEVEELIEQLSADPSRTAILTDIDGTIAPITMRPEETGVPDSARDALEALGEKFALVGCITGRRAAEARRLVGVEGITYSGNHGMETLEPDSHELQLDLTLRGHEDAAACFLDNIDASRLEDANLRREDKGPIQTLHWRGSESEAAAEALAGEIAAEAMEAGLEPHWGRKVLEIRPAGAGGKGAAIHALLAGKDLDLAVYAGDDRTDVDAFRVLMELTSDPEPLVSGLCVGIASAEGPEHLAEHSDFVLSSPEEWISVLERLGS